jgi:sec-independent protein translocase protein TatA
MNVFGIGLPEMLLIFGVALLVFGPKKLPEIGKTLGKTLKGFQEASSEFQNEFKKAADQIEESASKPMQAVIEPPAQIKAADKIQEATLAEEPSEPA